MSEENVANVRRLVEAVNRRDVDAFVADATPDVEWDDSIFWSEVSRTYRGTAELRQWFNQVVVEPWESLHCEIVEIAEVGDDRVFFGGVLTARGKDSGAETQARFWQVNWFADGKTRRREVFLERDEALEAAGLTK